MLSLSQWGGATSFKHQYGNDVLKDSTNITTFSNCNNFIVGKKWMIQDGCPLNYDTSYVGTEGKTKFLGHFVGLNKRIDNINLENLSQNQLSRKYNEKLFKEICYFNPNHFHQNESTTTLHQLLKPNKNDYVYENCHAKCNLDLSDIGVKKQETLSCPNDSRLTYTRTYHKELTHPLLSNLVLKNNAYHLKPEDCSRFGERFVEDDNNMAQRCVTNMVAGDYCNMGNNSEFNFQFEKDNRGRVVAFSVGLRKRHSWRDNFYDKNFDLDKLLSCGNEKTLNTPNIKEIYVANAAIDDFSEVFVNNNQVVSLPYQNFKNLKVCDTTSSWPNKKVYQNGSCNEENWFGARVENHFFWGADFTRIYDIMGNNVKWHVNPDWVFPLRKINFKESLVEKNNVLNIKTWVANGGSMYYMFHVVYNDQ